MSFRGRRRRLIFLTALPFLPLGALPQGSASPAPVASAGLTQSSSAPDAAELTSLLRQFLDAVPKNDPAMHDRFWADDLIYTRAVGVRIDKPELMRQIRAEAAASLSEDRTTYSAEEIRIQQYGNTAIVAFRLVGTTHKGDKTEVANYFNTGTFLKRDDKWQAVAWQATKIPAEGEAKK